MKFEDDDEPVVNSDPVVEGAVVVVTCEDDDGLGLEVVELVNAGAAFVKGMKIQERNILH